MYMQASSQRMISGYMPKHYQIPKKEKSAFIENHPSCESDIQNNLKKIQESQ